MPHEPLNWGLEVDLCIFLWWKIQSEACKAITIAWIFGKQSQFQGEWCHCCDSQVHLKMRNKLSHIRMNSAPYSLVCMWKSSEPSAPHASSKCHNVSSFDCEELHFSFVPVFLLRFLRCGCLYCCRFNARKKQCAAFKNISSVSTFIAFRNCLNQTCNCSIHSARLFVCRTRETLFHAQNRLVENIMRLCVCVCMWILMTAKSCASSPEWEKKLNVKQRQPAASNSNNIQTNVATLRDDVRWLNGIEMIHMRILQSNSRPSFHNSYSTHLNHKAQEQKKSSVWLFVCFSCSCWTPV